MTSDFFVYLLLGLLCFFSGLVTGCAIGTTCEERGVRTVAGALFVLIAVGLIIVWAGQRPPTRTMLLIQTAAPQGEAEVNRLWMPCPLTPKNIPPRQETIV